MTNRTELERHGRLTTGNAPLHERRKHLTNGIRDAVHEARTAMANWPREFEIPDDHDLIELLRIADVICDNLEQP